MTDTFTLTGRILDRNLQPVEGAQLDLNVIPANLDDPTENVIYGPAPEVTTDADGRLVVQGADTPDVELVMGPQYAIRSNYGKVLALRRFTAAEPLVTAGGTLDLTDLPVEPVETPPTFADVIAGIPAGKSAYELAVDDGFVGTEVEWQDSLTGPIGPSGANFTAVGNAGWIGTHRQNGATILDVGDETLYVIPVWFPAPIVLAAVRLQITSGGTGVPGDTVEVAHYDPDDHGWIDWDSLDTLGGASAPINTTGVKDVNCHDTPLAAGLNYFALRFAATPEVLIRATDQVSSQGPVILPSTISPSPGTEIAMFSKAGVTAMPNTAQTLTAEAGAVPVLWFKAGA